MAVISSPNRAPSPGFNGFDPGPLDYLRSVVTIYPVDTSGESAYAAEYAAQFAGDQQGTFSGLGLDEAIAEDRIGDRGGKLIAAALRQEAENRWAERNYWLAEAGVEIVFDHDHPDPRLPLYHVDRALSRWHISINPEELGYPESRENLFAIGARDALKVGVRDQLYHENLILKKLDPRTEHILRLTVDAGGRLVQSVIDAELMST